MSQTFGLYFAPNKGTAIEELFCGSGFFQSINVVSISTNTITSQTITNSGTITTNDLVTNNETVSGLLTANNLTVNGTLTTNNIVPANPVSFRVERTSGVQTIAPSTPTVVTFPSVIYNNGGHFSGNTYTVPEDGPFNFGCCVNCNGAVSGSSKIRITRNGNEEAVGVSNLGGGNGSGSCLTTTNLFTAGDQIRVTINSTAPGNNDIQFATFFGNRVYF